MVRVKSIWVAAEVVWQLKVEMVEDGARVKLVAAVDW